MSARGARSRKAVAKNIEKQEKKAAVKQKAPVETIRRPTDAFARWPSAPPNASREFSLPTRQLTISSEASHASQTSSNSGSNARPAFHTVSSQESNAPARRRTSISGSTSRSDDSSMRGKDKTKYAAKGKETKAPRGRGGGVPIKKPVNATPVPPLFRAETSLAFTPTHQKTWMNFRIWSGGEQGMKPYAGFDFDEHMQTGTVLIYFKEEQINEERPIPQLRAEIDVLESAGSTWLNNALLFGRLDDDALEDDDWMLPGSPESSLSPQALSPNFPQPPGHRMLAPTSPAGRSPPPFQIDQQYYGVPRSVTAPTPPDSDMGYLDSSPPPFSQLSQQQLTHELWFAAPAHIKTPQGQRLHHVAIRNFLAMLHDKPIVGSDFFEMLLGLQPEIQVMYDLDHDDQSRISSNERSVQMITNYLTQHKLDDVRRSIKQSMCLLAWSELDNVKWKQGYLETFVHLTGVLCPELEEVPEFRRLSLATRRNLGIAAKQLQLRVIEAEEKLGPFDFEDLWFDPTKMANHPVYQSYQAFRHFLINYYTRIYGNWPPVQGKTWLNRKMVLELQQDFGALYDYLVNRDVAWDSREERPGKKWQMVNRKTEDFRADRPDLSVTDMLVTFDNKHGYLHIPHPYPLLPREVPQSKPAVQKKSLFGLKKSKTEPAKDAKTHLQLSIIYSDATNIEKLDDSFTGSALIDAFERFELSTELKPTTTPREARLGRWILLYGILQCLSTLSVDVQSLRHTDGVRYFLNTDLKRLPEWVTNGEAERYEPGQTRSWCWQRSWDPTPVPGVPVELHGESVGVGAASNNAGMGERELNTVGAGQDTHSHGPGLQGFHHSRRNSATLSSPLSPHRNSPHLHTPLSHPPSSSPQNNTTAHLQSDIHRISEKIDHLSLSSSSSSSHQRQPQQQHQQHPHQHQSQSPPHYPHNHPSLPRALDYQQRRDNEKGLQEEFASAKRNQFRFQMENTSPLNQNQSQTLNQNSNLISTPTSTSTSPSYSPYHPHPHPHPTLPTTPETETETEYATRPTPNLPRIPSRSPLRSPGSPGSGNGDGNGNMKANANGNNNGTGTGNGNVSTTPRSRAASTVVASPEYTWGAGAGAGAGMQNGMQNQGYRFVHGREIDMSQIRNGGGGGLRGGQQGQGQQGQGQQGGQQGQGQGGPNQTFPERGQSRGFAGGRERGGWQFADDTRT
ncbi:hypothetical protein P280DRAFT_515457 [Massarina eburnea CBS 473.64]|uniref:DUF8004 domain-containing protein n=1 Tax=Massarina eburnea CBS 473.64 TaxID=1395130 RepID=A0A6A6S6Z1_9PLEO|nr:hypothetical protein P280DRAFT_515457 [Massarina eburnea CBS 473.64]